MSARSTTAKTPERDHRRAGARDRPHRGRPSLAAARAAGECADRLDHRDAARRRRDGRRRGGRHAQQQSRPGRRRRDSGAAGDDPPLAALLSCARRRKSADRAAVKFLNATGQSAKGMQNTFKRFADDMLIVSSRDRSLSAVPSDAARARRPRWTELVKTNPYWDKIDPPELQLRHDMMRAKLAGFLERPDTVARRYPLDRHQPAGALCARDRGLPHRRLSQRARADRRADPDAAEQSLLPRAQGPGAARRRAARRGDRAAAPRRRARAERHADPHHARAGAGRDRRQPLFGRGDLAAARRDAARAGRTGRLFAARHGLWPQGRRTRKPISPPRRRRLPAAT